MNIIDYIAKGHYEEDDFWEMYNNSDDYQSIYDNISTEQLLNFIDMSNTQKALSIFVCFLLEHVDKKIITEEVFQALIKYPSRKSRRSFFVSLSHNSISFYQLEYICEKKISTEAFAQMVKIMVYDNTFSEIDLERAIKHNKEWVDAIPWSQYFADSSISSAKCEVMSKMIQKGQN